MADAQLPLSGVILCCTSIPPEKRTDLAAIASQMGAVHKLDLTSDVTHLIVGDTETPKYKFVAKERPDVKCVLPSWVEAVRASWLEGGETDVEELEQEHRLPTFTGLRLCVTGFDDLVYRKQLEDIINDNGGEYRGNLTHDVTHLVAKEPTGAKYSYAGLWGIRIVAVEWLEQSYERGMILDESLYHLSIPPEQRGRDAWIRRSSSTTSLGKRTRGDEIVPQNARKLRRTASARLSSQNVGFWSELVVASEKPEESKEGAWDEQPKETVDEEATSTRIKSEGAAFPPTARGVQEALKKSDSEVNLGSFLGKSKENMFQGKLFILHRFNDKQTAILELHLCSHGAEIMEDVSGLPNTADPHNTANLFLVVPYTMSGADVPPIPKSKQHPTVVTDMWVERCLHQKRMEDPRMHAISTPFSRFPIAGFEELSITSTKFEGIELLHTSKAIKSIGGDYSEYLSAKSSVLVCKSVNPGHEKLRHAELWSVPAVHADWLWDSIRKGKLMPFGPYLVQPLTDPGQPRDVEKALDKAVVPSKTSERHDKPDATKKLERRRSPPKERFKQLKKESSRSKTNGGISNGFGPESLPSPKANPTRQDQAQASAIYLDDDTPAPFDSRADEDFSATLAPPSVSAPLQEITPNSSPPKRSTPPPKPISPLKTKDPPSTLEDSSLGSAISSLLAHHQRTNSHTNTDPKPPSSNTSDEPRSIYRRRRRQLFGRAPSNLSSHSTGGNPIDLSRASSVDTMNTDGLGTPLEPSNNTTTKNTTTKLSETNTVDKSNPTTADLNIYTANNQDDDPDRVEEQLQMTQLGYEDPDVAAWRERVAIKMGGGKVKAPPPGRKGAGAGTSALGKEGNAKDKGVSLGIAKRTRLATGGR